MSKAIKISVAEHEYLNLCRQVPVTNAALFDIKAVIANAERSCQTKELQDSLERSKELAKELVKEEREKDLIRLEPTNIAIKGMIYARRQKSY